MAVVLLRVGPGVGYPQAGTESQPSSAQAHGYCRIAMEERRSLPKVIPLNSDAKVAKESQCDARGTMRLIYRGVLKNVLSDGVDAHDAWLLG